MFLEKYYTTQDNIRLYYRVYGTYNADKPIILCLPGLTRNAKAFHDYAVHCLEQFNACLICPDMRGRGQSDYDSNSMNYNLMQESHDISNILTHEQINDVLIIGTSRGGMQSTILSGMLGNRLKGVILNDIGCIIPITALIRLQNLFAKDTAFVGDYDTALALFYKNDVGMTKNLTNIQEETIINQIFTYKEGHYYLDYDFKGLGEACGITLEQMKAVNPIICDLKPLFQSLRTVPTLLLQGENSDILPNDALEQTKLLLPDIKVYQFTNRGHVLYFNEPEVIAICDAFLREYI